MFTRISIPIQPLRLQRFCSTHSHISSGALTSKQEVGRCPESQVQPQVHLLRSKMMLPPTRLITTSSSLFRARYEDQTKEEATEETEDDVDENEFDEEEVEGEGEFVKKYYDPKDRTRVISPELSIKYMESNAYRQTYGDEPVWKHYRRNIKGGSWFVPQTREKCVRHGRVQGASPCPICRDRYLVLDYRNVKLLHQFIDEYSGVVYDTYKTGICQEQWKKLLVTIEKAKDYGLLNFDADQVYYDTELYKK